VNIPKTSVPTNAAPVAAPAAAAADFPVVWVPAANGMVPANAIIGGKESGRSLPVCRARYNQGVHPGKVVGKNCNFGYGGKEVLAPQYDVLVGNPGLLKQSPQFVRWIAAQGGQVPPGAFFGAYEPGRPILPICQAPYQGGVHVGKVVGGNCNFGYRGLEVLLPQYAVLVVGRIPVMAATAAVQDASNPVAIAAALNQALEARMAALQSEVLVLAAKPTTTAQPGPTSANLEALMMDVQAKRAMAIDPQLAQMKASLQAAQAKTATIVAFNTQLGALKSVKLITTDPTMRAKLDVQINELSAQIESSGNTQKMDILRLQTLTNKPNEASDIITNLMKSLADTSDSIIRTMKSVEDNRASIPRNVS